MDLVVAGLGWLGAALSLASYFLVTIGKVKAQSVGYQFMVLVSALALALYSAANDVWPNVVTNAVYMAIGIVMISLLLRSKAARVARALGRAVLVTGRTVAGSATTFARRPQFVVPVRRAEGTRVLSRAGQTGAGRRARPVSFRRSVRPAARPVDATI